MPWSFTWWGESLSNPDQRSGPGKKLGFDGVSPHHDHADIPRFCKSAITANFRPEHADAIRRALIEADLVDCMVALPGQLFWKFEMN